MDDWGIEYRYEARVVRVIDGDTVEFEIDLGFGVWAKEKIRLFGIDTPELRGEEKRAGEEARREVVDRLLQDDPEIEIETRKDKRGKYGRMLGIVWCRKCNDEGEPEEPYSLNDHLVDSGFAEPWFT